MWCPYRQPDFIVALHCLINMHYIHSYIAHIKMYTFGYDYLPLLKYRLYLQTLVM